MSNHYINEIGTEILVDCGQDISAATDYALEVRKPDGSYAEWTPTISDTDYLLYLTQSGDFNVSGMYSIQPYIELPGGWTGRGQAVFFYVYNYFDGD